MGITDFFSDIYESLTWTEAHAEAAPEEEKEEEQSEGGDDDGESDDKAEGGDDAEEEEEEEEEEEPVDPKPQLEEECANSAQCAPAKHHFEECVERVTAAQDDPDHKGPHEDCVEEFFHLQHCATSCAAPKLFRMLK